MKKSITFVSADQVEFPEPGPSDFKIIPFKDQVGFFPDLSQARPKVKIEGTLTKKQSEELFCMCVELEIKW